MKSNVLYTETLNLFGESEKVSQKKRQQLRCEEAQWKSDEAMQNCRQKNQVIFIQLDYERVNVATMIITNYWRPAMG